MKKSNWIVLAIAVIVSAFLLWLWYYLGFNKVDNPFDLALSIAWWCGVILLVWFIHRSEEKRQEQIRTIYVSPTALFNSERGLVDCPDPEQRVSLMEQILKDLKYDFHKEDMPDEDDFDFTYVVRTEDYKEKDSDDQKADAAKTDAEQTADEPAVAEQVTADAATTADVAASSQEEEDEPKWKGSVVKIDRSNGNDERDFDDRQQLIAALA